MTNNENTKKTPPAGDPAAEEAAPVSEAAATPEPAPEPNDRLAAMMRRSARREEAYVPTSQLRRFTLPDSAPIMRRVMGFLSDQARTTTPRTSSPTRWSFRRQRRSSITPTIRCAPRSPHASPI